MNLNGKKALVTGGAVRIGRAICEMLAGAGAEVCVHYNRSRNEAEDLQRSIEKVDGHARLFQADLKSEEACRHLIREAEPLDILINNASVFHKHTIDESAMQVVMDELWPNLFAPLQLMRAFAEQGRPGKIVNLLDRRITSQDAACVPYLLAKKALTELTGLAALHWAPRIAVNGVAPGAVLPPPGKGEAYMKDYAGPVPMDIQVTPVDVARAVKFVLENDTLTGQIIFVDGGQHLGNG